MIINLRQSLENDGFKVSFVQGGHCEVADFYYARAERGHPRDFVILSDFTITKNRHKVLGYVKIPLKIPD